MAEQQAGWYPDPSGDASKLRYWDGTQWTNDFSDASGFMQPTQTPPQQPFQAAQPDQPIQPVPPDKPIQPIPPDQPIPPIQPVQPVQPTPPIQPVQPVQPQAVQPVYYNPAGGQAPYGSGYQQAPAKQTNGFAIAALICGIAGLCPYTYCIIPIVAIVLGALGRRNPVNKSMATAGLILGIVGIAIFVLVIIFAYAYLYV